MTDTATEGEHLQQSQPQEQSEESIPPLVLSQLKEFNEALTDLEQTLEEYYSIGFEDHLKREANEMAEVDVTSMFAITSLTWVVACLKGDDPKENGNLISELQRTQEYVKRFKSAQQRKNAPRLNATAAKNFVRNALFEVSEEVNAQKAAKRAADEAEQESSSDSKRPNTAQSDEQCSYSYPKDDLKKDVER